MRKFSTIIVLVMLTLAIIACGGGRATGEITDFRSPDPSYSQLDLRQRLTVNLHFFTNTAAPDLDEVIGFANDNYFIPIINAELDVLFMPTTDRGTMYPLLLAGGDGVDVIFTAPWHSYEEEAAKGSFHELTPEFLQRYMPNVWRTQPPVSWEQARTQGVVYAVPNFGSAHNHKFVVIRDDLRTRYNLPILTDWNSLTNFLITIARNEQGMQGYAANATTWELMAVYLQWRNVLLTSQPIYFAWYDEHVDPRPDDLHFLYTSEWFADYSREMARLFEAGAWSRNVMQNTIGPRDFFVQGRAGMHVHNSAVFGAGVELQDNGFGTAGWYDISESVNARIRRMPYDNNMWAIAAMSDRIERSALVIDLMKTNVDLNILLKGGFEGRHYIRFPDNTFIPGPDRDDYRYNFWTWANEFPYDMVSAPTEATPPRQLELGAIFSPRVVDINMDGFRINLGPIQTEWAVISALIEEYRTSFECGIFLGDTEAKLQEFYGRLRQAGLDRVVTMFRNSYADYLSRMN